MSSTNSTISSPVSNTKAINGKRTTPPPSYVAMTRQSSATTVTSHSSSHSSTTTKSSSKSSSSESRSFNLSSKKQVIDVHLDGYILHAKFRKGDGSDVLSKLDLGEHIGIVAGKLVWGRRHFHNHCKSIRVEKHTLIVECVYEGKTVTSTLDLARYLTFSGGILALKVPSSTPEISGLFSEARWMKVKIVTEPDASLVVRNAAFKEAFSSIAQSTSTHVVAEMTEELVESMTEEIKVSMREKVKKQMTQVVSETMKKQIHETISLKVEEAFAVAKKATIEACSTVIDEAVQKVTTECTESIFSSTDIDIASQCSVAISSAIKSVTASTIEHFQERVEILMERELAAATLRGASTKAAYLNMLADSE